MIDDGGIPPLPRRVPGASGSPRPTVRVDLGNISEDLRQRVLTAIAHELELDEAERQRTGAGPAIGTGASPGAKRASRAAMVRASRAGAAWSPRAARQAWPPGMG